MCSVPFSNSTTEVEESSLAEGSVFLAGDVAVRESVVCQGTYVLKSDDIDALEIMSIASVWAADEFNAEVRSSATATTSLDQVGSFYQVVADKTPWRLVIKCEGRLFSYLHDQAGEKHSFFSGVRLPNPSTNLLNELNVDKQSYSIPRGTVCFRGR